MFLFLKHQSVFQPQDVETVPGVLQGALRRALDKIFPGVRGILPLGFSPLCYVISGKDPWREAALAKGKWRSFWDGIQYLACSKSNKTDLWTFLLHDFFLLIL